MSQDSIDLYYLEMAYRVAMASSTDPSTQNGAIVIDPARAVILASGANHFPRGVKESDERWDRPLKYSYVEHAERNAIYDAARNGVRTLGTTMYCPWYACQDCARAIIQSGIKRVVGHILPEHENNSRWKDSIKLAMEMLKEAGVECDYIKGKIGNGIAIRMNGEIVHP